MNKELENYIKMNVQELDTKKPGEAVLGRILQEMEAHRPHRPRSILIPFQVIKWVAACLLLTAGATAWWYVTRPAPATEIVNTSIPEKPPLPQQAIDSAVQQAMIPMEETIATPPKALVGKTKPKQTILLAGLYNKQSAASRINAIAAASRLKNKDREVIDVLAQMLDNDPNTNVRLAALEGLTRFYREPYVRKKLVASLKKQQDPVLQINLIDLLTRIREWTILSELEKIVNDGHTHQAVKRVAWSSILQLSPTMIN